MASMVVRPPPLPSWLKDDIFGPFLSRMAINVGLLPPVALNSRYMLLYITYFDLLPLLPSPTLIEYSKNLPLSSEILRANVLCESDTLATAPFKIAAHGFGSSSYYELVDEGIIDSIFMSLWSRKCGLYLFSSSRLYITWLVLLTTSYCLYMNSEDFYENTFDWSSNYSIHSFFW